MSFKHLRMINSASKCPKITLEGIKFSKPEKNFPKKSSWEGDIESFEGATYLPPLAETLLVHSYCSAV
jgi:hypothetical protein